jgi:signal peptide peptidase SppA
MARPGILSRLIPLQFRKSTPVVHVVRLEGAIGIGTPLKPPLTAKGINDVLERAFSKKGIAAVALAVNSPGGSATQSAMIHARIRQLAVEHKLPVYVFCEDVAASGGYWLACAGDEIYADDSSIVGSIGVISASFGLVEAIAKLGIERRVHTAGENKSILDPFKPEKPEDVERLLAIQTDVHAAFKELVKTRRAGKLKGEEAELFSGAFWSGRQALERGLIDGIGHLHEVLRRKFGEKVQIRAISAPKGWGLNRLGLGSNIDFTGSFIEALETRAVWSRFGL